MCHQFIVWMRTKSTKARTRSRASACTERRRSVRARAARSNLAFECARNRNDNKLHYMHLRTPLTIRASKRCKKKRYSFRVSRRRGCMRARHHLIWNAPERKALRPCVGRALGVRCCQTPLLHARRFCPAYTTCARARANRRAYKTRTSPSHKRNAHKRQ